MFFFAMKSKIRLHRESLIELKFVSIKSQKDRMNISEQNRDHHSTRLLLTEIQESLNTIDSNRLIDLVFCAGAGHPRFVSMSGS